MEKKKSLCSDQVHIFQAAFMVSERGEKVLPHLVQFQAHFPPQNVSPSFLFSIISKARNKDYTHFRPPLLALSPKVLLRRATALTEYPQS